MALGGILINKTLYIPDYIQALEVEEEEEVAVAVAVAVALFKSSTSIVSSIVVGEEVDI